MDTTIFGDFDDFGDLVVFCPGGSELRSWRSQEVKESLELQNDGLRALEEALDDLTRRAFTCCFSYNAQRVIRKRGNDDLSPVPT